MANIFRAADVVRVGIRIEENGRDFYRAMASRAASPETEKLFSFLAKEEERHIAVFEKMLASLGQREPRESYSGEYTEYIKDLAGEHVFTGEGSGEKAAASIDSDRGAIDFGVDIEKESIVFYVGMKGAVPESDHPAIDGLIREEQSHLRMLLEMRKTH